MSCTATPSAPAAPVVLRTAVTVPWHPARRLSSGASFYLLGSITLSFLAGSSAPTPLYAVYRAQWGFSPTLLTLVFGIYAIAVLLALLVAGRLSDHIGRRPVLMAATLAQVATMVIFAHASGLAELLLGRVLQGLSAGLAIAAVGAALLDIDKARGAVANAVAPMLGTALGGVLAGLMVQYLPQPTHLIYAVLGLVFVMQGIGVLYLPETAALRPGAWASLRPQLAVPASVRKPLLRVLPAVVAVWALAGFYASLGPTLVRTLVGSDAIALGGLALFVLAGSGAWAVLASQARQAPALLRTGALALLAGLALVMAALSLRSMLLFMVGTSVAGVGFGSGFQGALRTLVSGLAAHERAGVLAVLFVVSYLAMGLPAILAGYGLARQGDIVATAGEFAAAVFALAGMALLGTLFRRDPAAAA